MYEEEHQHLEALRDQYQKRIRVLQSQSAKFGLHVPPHIVLEIEEAQDEINKIDALLNFSQGLPESKGKEDFELISDTRLLRQHRVIFERPAFRVPCENELSLKEFIDAIDDVQLAINTGRLYSRNDRFLMDFPGYNEYKMDNFRKTFLLIVEKLTELKRIALQLKDRVGDQNMVTFLSREKIDDDMKGHIKEIDEIRNQILVSLNSLLIKIGDYPLPLIGLESRDWGPSIY